VSNDSDATYADRASGRVFEDARTMVDAYLQRFSERAGTNLQPLDDSGYTTVRKGSAVVGINVLEDHGVLLILAPVMKVPKAGNHEKLFRRLLELSFITTADAAFAIDEQKEEVFVRLCGGFPASITRNSRIWWPRWPKLRTSGMTC